MISPFQSFNPNTFEFSDSLDAKLMPVSSIYLVGYKIKKKQINPPSPQSQKCWFKHLRTWQPSKSLHVSFASSRPEVDRTGHRVLWGSPQDYSISTMKCAVREEDNRLINDWTGIISLLTRHQLLKEELTKLMWCIWFINYDKRMTKKQLWPKFVK